VAPRLHAGERDVALARSLQNDGIDYLTRARRDPTEVKFRAGRLASSYLEAAPAAARSIFPRARVAAAV